MFESDDWDMDQDFLNDVDDKAVTFYSQTPNQETEPKRRKICNDPISSFDEVDLHDKHANDKNVIKSDRGKESRRNFILGMFNKNLLDEDVFQHDSKKPSDANLLNMHSNNVHNVERSQLPRKNLLLGILKNKNVQDIAMQNSKKSIDPQKCETEIKSNSNISSVNNTNQIKCQTSKSNPQRENGLNHDKSKVHLIENSRKNLLHNIMKQQSVNSVESENDTNKDTSTVTKYPQNQIHSYKKMTLVRKFPGPAGLLPDDISANIPPISYLNSLEENEKTIDESNSSKLPNYCSQNTNNLFTEGAWQLMLNDLPRDFLKDYEIATVKQMTSTKGYSSTKVKFLAGIVERIDHSHENPPIVLKDFTDTIQGIVHRDIPLKYPGLLEPNVVLLLHDVGLLKISSTFVSNKYQILISPSSLLGIYTNKGEIERTHHMASVLENVSKQEIEKTQNENEDCSFTKPLEIHSSRSNFQFKLKYKSNIQESVNFRKNTEETKNKSIDISFNKTTKGINESVDFDDNISFSVSSNDITNSQNQKNFNDSTLNINKAGLSKQQFFKPHLEKQKESTSRDDKDRAENLLKTLKKFAPPVNSKKRLLSESKNRQINAELSISKDTYSKQVQQNIASSTFSKELNVNDYDTNLLCYSKTENAQLNNTLEKNKHSVRSKLLQFKNTEISSTSNSEPEIVMNSKENIETLIKQKSPETSDFFSNVLCNTENDSDDDILSQLDMDTIFSSFNKEN